MYKVLAIYDRKTEVYGPLIQERSLVAAVRAFGDVLRSGKESIIVSHPEDFDLVTFGDFNEVTGELSVHDAQLVITAEALIRQLSSGEVKVPEELQDSDRVMLASRQVPKLDAEV